MKPLMHQYVNTAVLDLFPRKLPSGATIYDEKCSCGHLRSSHHDRFAIGHGNCGQTPCGCPQFTWAEWLREPAPLTDTDRTLAIVDRALAGESDQERDRR